MRNKTFAFAFSLSLGLGGIAAEAAEPLRVSIWGGSWRDTVAETIGKKFTEETGVPVEYVTGGTIDRLNKAQLAGGTPETDVTITTSHVGWLYANSGLFEELDASRISRFGDVMPTAKISPYHLGLWSYVYTIGYRPDLLPEGITFESWKDLWDPKLEGQVGAPDFDPSHLIAVSAILSGAEVKDWEKGTELLKQIKPNVKTFYSSDGTSQEKMATGETSVQVILSGNAFHQISQGVPVELVIPKEGAIIGIDAIGINKGTRQQELAYKFLDVALDPEVQAEITKLKKLGPLNSKAVIDPELAALPGVFTSEEQIQEQAIVIDHKLRAEMLPVWKTWFTENLMN
ncbi:PotD/PotF family extracellular solute-binding protein [Telmatospirillum sp. J64-1]|uniref:ABC transporter substrate-binding protein n=1 Tax=Telmatospirillum sp. J64-1 TaxID=2502183 RepID=UPI00115E5775|nr:ABC transporter substrate-binding protein [Telmatospirillum sp. J64-1]